MKKITTIVDFLKFHNIEKVRSCSVAVGCHRSLIKCSRNIANPITILLKKDVPIEWSAQCEASFFKLKSAFKHKPALQYLKFDENFFWSQMCLLLNFAQLMRNKGKKLSPIACM